MSINTSCSIPLYSNDFASLRRIVLTALQKNPDESASEVYNLIVKGLKNLKSFRFGGEISNLVAYTSSVKSLRASILILLKKYAEKPYLANKYTELVKLFGEQLLADAGINQNSIVTDTDPEGPYMEDNPEMANEDERVKLKLDDIVSDYYGTVIKANNYRKQLFGLDLIRAAIIDVEAKLIVRNNQDLNKALCLLKNRYLESIVSYLKSIDPNFKGESKVFDKDFKKLRGYEQTLNRFYNELKNKKSESNIESLITEGWRRRLTGQSDLFYDALNAYVNLVYFDDMLLDSIGKVIELQDPALANVEIDNSFLKYKFSKGDEHKRKGFQSSENRDALKDIAKFSKLILSTIPVYSSISGKFLNRYVNTGNFANAITSLFTRAHLLGNNHLELQRAIVEFHSNPYSNSGIIFKAISDPEVLKSLIGVGVNRFNINILTSVFDHVYNTSNEYSIKTVETKYLKDLFSIDGYSIMDCINGVIDRTMDATYLLTVYSGESEMTEVTLKKKFTDRKVSYNTINRINQTNARRPKDLRRNLVKRFGDILNLNSEGTTRVASIKVGDIHIIGKTSSKDGILDSKDITVTFSSQLIAKLFNAEDTTIDLISSESVNRLISGENLNANEKAFRDVLSFIDSFLGTKFLTEDGIDKLYLYKTVASDKTNYLEALLQSAIRASAVNYLYDRFELVVGKNPSYPTILNFQDFLRDNYTPFKNMDFEDRKETSKFFSNENGIPELISVRTNENWIDNMAEIEAILTGDVSKSTINDINGNKIANNRTSFLGGNLLYYLSKYRKVLNAATTPLLFTNNPDLVVKTVLNNDAQSRLGIKKNTKDMRASELFYTSIVHSFFGSFLQSDINPDKFKKGKNDLYKTVLILPTTFSDKTSFVTYAINANKKLKALGKSYDGKVIWELNTDLLIDLYMDTIGLAYVNLYNNVLEDLRTVLELPNATVEEINESLKLISESELISKAHSLGIELKVDTHYRKFGSTCRFNELLHHYATDLYVNRNSLKERFGLEKLNFLNDLLTSGVSFYTKYSDDSDDVFSSKESSLNILSKIIDKFYTDTGERANFLSKWVKNNKLVLAIVDGKLIVNGVTLPSGSKVELNPLLEKYFYTDSLLANNLRFELTGSEVAHPDKAKINYSEMVNDLGITPETNPEYFAYKEDGTVLMTKDSIRREIPAVNGNFNDLLWVKALPNLQSVYNKAILKIEATAQGTQLKRNVIIPATLLYELMNALNGIPSRMRVAVIKDTKASIFNFRGDNTTEDAHDGSAWINPFTSILENKALQDLEVGVDKKPIWHSFDPRTMSATLLKFATFTMTNERMRTSLNSNIALYNLFKLMTNLLWSTDTVDENGNITGKKWNNSKELEFDLISTKGFRKNQWDKINFIEDILARQPIFYNENGDHYKIIDFGRDEHGYYTKEAKVNMLGIRYDPNHDIKTYHVFDSLSNHLKFRDVVPPTEEVHLINSLFELFNVMGGIYSESLIEDEQGNKFLQYSDASSYAVVNFMNNISIRVGKDSNDLSLDTYYQPLKEMMIDYVANQSAVKNGAANINGKEAWMGELSLTYMTLDSDGLGIQMDADHTIDESEMTEFSQVISALEAGGRLHHISKQVYKTLGELAVLASRAEIDAATTYISLKVGNVPLDRIRSEIYDIIGRTLVNNYKLKDNRVDLAAPIIYEIKKKFNLNEDHALDEFKLPFSDSNLYSEVISTFVSNINSKSIKRKYPGSGCVMVPGYGIILNYKYGGKIKAFDDVLEEARVVNNLSHFFLEFNPQLLDIQTYNRLLVHAYLKQILESEWLKASSSVEEFMPTDVIDILADGNYIGTVDLNDIGTYYKLKGFTPTDPDGINAEATRRGFIGELAEKARIDISLTASITYAMNVTKARDLAPARLRWQWTNANNVVHTTNIFDTAPVRYSFLMKKNPTFNSKENRHLIQKVLDDLENGIYNGQKVIDGSVENLAAELVISNMYASKFNIKGRSLSEIIERGPNAFRIGRVLTIYSSHYELAFTTNNGRHTYITFKTPKVDDLNAYQPKKVGWKYTRTIIEKGHRNVYATTKDGQILFKVGRYVPVKDISSLEDLTNIKIDSSGLALEYKEFVSNYKVVEMSKNGKPISYNLYSINATNIGEVLTNPKLADVDKYISNILSDIYESREYNGVRLNYTMSGSSAERIRRVIPYLRMSRGADSGLAKLLSLTVSKYMDKIDPKTTFVLDLKSYEKDLKEYYNLRTDEIYASFLKSLTFTSSRIPAQTLQSFMQMLAVGFTQSSKNICYVSHWQTW